MPTAFATRGRIQAPTQLNSTSPLDPMQAKRALNLIQSQKRKRKGSNGSSLYSSTMSTRAPIGMNSSSFNDTDYQDMSIYENSYSQNEDNLIHNPNSSTFSLLANSTALPPLKNIGKNFYKSRSKNNNLDSWEIMNTRAARASQIEKEKEEERQRKEKEAKKNNLKPVLPFYKKNKNKSQLDAFLTGIDAEIEGLEMFENGDNTKQKSKHSKVLNHMLVERRKAEELVNAAEISKQRLFAKEPPEYLSEPGMSDDGDPDIHDLPAFNTRQVPDDFLELEKNPPKDLSYPVGLTHEPSVNEMGKFVDDPFLTVAKKWKMGEVEQQYGCSASAARKASKSGTTSTSNKGGSSSGTGSNTRSSSKASASNSSRRRSKSDSLVTDSVMTNQLDQDNSIDYDKEFSFQQSLSGSTAAIRRSNRAPPGGSSNRAPPLQRSKSKSSSSSSTSKSSKSSSSKRAKMTDLVEENNNLAANLEDIFEVSDLCDGYRHMREPGPPGGVEDAFVDHFPMSHTTDEETIASTDHQSMASTMVPPTEHDHPNSRSSGGNRRSPHDLPSRIQQRSKKPSKPSKPTAENLYEEEQQIVEPDGGPSRGKKKKPHAPSATQRQRFHEACRFGNVNVVRILLHELTQHLKVEQYAEVASNSTAIFSGIQAQKAYQVVEFLLKNGFNPNARNHGIGETPLIYLIKHKIRHGTNSAWVQEKDSVGLIKLLVEFRAEVNTRESGMQRTALWWAAKYNNKPAVSLLLQLRADPRIPDKKTVIPSDCTTNQDVDLVLQRALTQWNTNPYLIDNPEIQKPNIISYEDDENELTIDDDEINNPGSLFSKQRTAAIASAFDAEGERMLRERKNLKQLWDKKGIKIVDFPESAPIGIFKVGDEETLCTVEITKGKFVVRGPTGEVVVDRRTKNVRKDDVSRLRSLSNLSDNFLEL
ncbi:unnamed protein product [Amoebophrya sp. A120]|nr:unnamed protein product [Amoebophrya sp. A120]|eukprot:GSA120T00015798001.1